MEAAGGAGSSGECDGEEQEDPSSSSLLDDDSDIAAALQSIDLEESKPNVSEEVEEDELAAFRVQWRRELESAPVTSAPPAPDPAPADPEPITEEEKAKKLFLVGVELERSGKLYEAIQHYKRAMQILPDVETRLYEAEKLRADTPEVEFEAIEAPRVENPSTSDDEDAVEGEDLVARFQRILARKGALFQPENESKELHLSWLPYEVLQLVLRWVVSSELDAASLERAAASCRGLFVAAREPDLWRDICVRTWGIECGSPRALGFPSWRAMFSLRPRLRLHGCYISKTTYIRHGENCFQDQFYRPWYLVDYYRYLRFFPEGVALMLTTPEEPAACVGLLRTRGRAPGVLHGHYRLHGNKVVIIVKKTPSEKKEQVHTRFRSRRKETSEQHEQTFQLELELRNARSRRNSSLYWSRYSVSSRRDSWTQFELAPANYPPFSFSRVRSYAADAVAPLPATTNYN